MLRPYLLYFIINTFTTTIGAFLYNKLVRDERIYALLHRIDDLEKTVEMLQQAIETIEEDIHDKNKVIESNIALNNKLEDFINYNYDIN